MTNQHHKRASRTVDANEQVDGVTRWERWTRLRFKAWRGSNLGRWQLDTIASELHSTGALEVLGSWRDVPVRAVRCHTVQLLASLCGVTSKCCAKAIEGSARAERSFARFCPERTSTNHAWSVVSPSVLCACVDCVPCTCVLRGIRSVLPSFCWHDRANENFVCLSDAAFWLRFVFG